MSLGHLTLAILGQGELGALFLGARYGIPSTSESVNVNFAEKTETPATIKGFVPNSETIFGEGTHSSLP